jgi:predicted aspartyl protease
MSSAVRLWRVAVNLTGPKGSRLVYGVVDTGATVTLMPPDVLLAIGCDPAISKERAGIFTVSGTEILAIVHVPEISALGYRARNLEVMCHSLPQGGRANGLLGMNFLLQIPQFQNLDKHFQEFFV